MDSRELFYIDIQDKRWRERFIFEVLSWGIIALKCNEANSIEGTQKEMINSTFPFVLDLEKMEMDYIRNTTCAAAAIMDKSKFITSEEALAKIQMKMSLDQYKKEIKRFLIERNNYTEAEADKLMKIYDEDFPELLEQGYSVLGAMSAIMMGY